MLTLRKDKGLATLVFDHPTEKVNTLSMAVMQELSEIFDDISTDSTLNCLVIQSEKPGIFIAGADISEIQTMTDQAAGFELVRGGQGILNQLEALSIPTISVIDGACLGGGCELALACQYRVATLSSKTQIGLPEVNLGIIPGFGGTQRLPRLVGLVESLGIILPGKAVDGKKALKMGLVDLCVPSEFLQQRLDVFIQDVLTGAGRGIQARRQARRPFMNKVLERIFLGRWFIYMSALKRLEDKTKGHYPAPARALKSAVFGFSSSLEKGLVREAKAFSSCIGTSVSASLIQLFFSQEAQKKCYFDKTIDVKALNQAAVIGSGLMGSGIAWAMSYRGISVVLKDVDFSFVTRGLSAIHGIYRQLKKIRRISQRELVTGMHRVTPGCDYRGFSKMDVVVEAVLEKVSVKQQVYAELEAVVEPGCIIATNTSSLDVDDLSSKLTHPERFVGLHFFSPVNRMPLVEIIPSSKTDPVVLQTMVQLVKRLKKVPVVVKNCPGFLVNRVLLPYISEAMHCLADGVSIVRCDRVCLNFGMPVGPLTLADEVGLDVGIKVLDCLEAGYGDRMAIPTFMKSLYADGKFLGKKSGSGFYVYEGKRKRPNAAVHESVRAFQTGDLADLSDTDVLHRCLFVMINEAARCLDEGVVSSARELDLAMVMGTGFPPFHGGLCRYTDAIGLAFVVERLYYFSRLYGSRFEPCTFLKELAQRDGAFYE